MIPDDPWYQSFVQSVSVVPSAIAAEVAALAEATSQAGGGNFEFHGDQVVTIRKQWVDLQTTVANAMVQNAMVNGSGKAGLAPGNEQASDHVADAINTSNNAYGDYLTSMKNYIDKYVDNLNSAILGYHGTEQSIIDAARQIQSQQS